MIDSGNYEHMQSFSFQSVLFPNIGVLLFHLIYDSFAIYFNEYRLPQYGMNRMPAPIFKKCSMDQNNLNP